MTEPKEIAASVERVERQEPPEPEGWIALIWDSCSWEVDTRYVIYSRDGALFNCRAAGDIRLVRIGGQPQPSATPATANLPVGDLVNVLRACEMHRTELEQGLDHNATILARGYRKSETEVRSWLAGQPQPEQPSAEKCVCNRVLIQGGEVVLPYCPKCESEMESTPTPPAPAATAKVERKVPVEPINDVIDAASVHAFLTPIGSERTRISNALNTVRRWLAEQEG